MLDEPTAALDLAHQHSVMRLMQQLAAQGHGVIAVLHDLNLAETYADQALVMRDGRLDTMGRCEEVLQPSLIQRIWGVVCERLPRPASQGSWLALSAMASAVTD
jgi:iron complex transport system ATP-binding protein